MARLDRLKCIVTGAASGIGRAIALRFAAEGAIVLGTDVDAVGLEHVGGEALGSLRTMPLNVTNEAAVDAAFAGFAAEEGRIDVLVNSAGIAHNGTALEADLASWERVLAINLTGVWLGCRAALRQMTEQRGGVIVNIASIGSLVASPSNAAYLASKGGVAMLTKSIAIDFGHLNIRANAICPGTVPTPLVQNRYPERGEAEESDVMASIQAAAAGRYPLKRLGSVDEIAALTVYLASDESGFMSGSLLPIDGGISAAAWLVGQ
jgi:NAD(P)-dependent dehydrogenase (short-subunit alcohol dehydrogenase family)